jgi:hypothetical protein
LTTSTIKSKRNKPKNNTRRQPKQKVRRSVRSAKKKNVTFPDSFKHKLILAVIELAGLSITLVSAIIVLLGYSAERFSGTRFLTSLLPFAIGVLVLILFASFLFLFWWKLRRSLQGRTVILMPVISVMLAIGSGIWVMDDRFALAFNHFRMLVGGKQEVRRVTLAHQVYAAYRRQGVGAMRQMVARGEKYSLLVEDAAGRFQIDPDLLLGIAAAESSFLPRNSSDGGRGLFQITRVPKVVENEAQKHFSGQKRSIIDDRYNAYLAAATFKYYLDEMHGDLLLGLLAYNIGPANGGLRFIMQKYGVTDFTTIQPYLQHLPRDYPIRVLSYALAFRLWRQEGTLPAYQEGSNAVRIQRIGIPGLTSDF